MIVNFAKSLDRPLEILGIKGKWLTVFLIFAGGGIVIGVISGIAISSGVGISVAIVLAIVGFVLTLSLQGKTSYRQIARQRVSSKMQRFVRWNETVSRVMLPDPLAARSKEPCKGMSCTVDGERKVLCGWCSYRPADNGKTSKEVRP